MNIDIASIEQLRIEIADLDMVIADTSRSSNIAKQDRYRVRLKRWATCRRQQCIAALDTCLN